LIHINTSTPAQNTSTPGPFSSRRRGEFPLLEERVRVRWFRRGSG